MTKTIETGFLQSVRIMIDEAGEIPPILEVVVNWNHGMSEDGTTIAHRQEFPKNLEGPLIFDHLHDGIKFAVAAIELQYGFHIAEPILTAEEIGMLRRQYEEGVTLDER